MLIISNTGEVEPEAFTLLGATTKREDATKIGFFGSGNKYAIATLLRMGVPFRIFSGEQEIVISTQKAYLRGQEYEQILINGQSTSMTTSMGPDWELWFTLREFICNAMDEGGYTLSLGDLVPVPGVTSIVVEETEEVLEFYNNRGKYILESAPIHTVLTVYGNISIHPKSENMNVFRKGISVTAANQHNMLYDYDFSNIDINESRVYKYEFQVKERIAAFYTVCTNPKLIQEFLACRNVFEEDLYWTNNNKFSDAWFELLKDKTLAPKSFYEHMNPEERWSYTWIDPRIIDKLLDQFPTLRVLGGENESGWIPLDDQTCPQLESAVMNLGILGIKTDVPILVGNYLDPAIIASYNKKVNEIRVSKDHVEDIPELELTLMEEIYHTKGYSDGSRAFECKLMSEIRDLRRLLVGLKEQIVSAI